MITVGYCTRESDPKYIEHIKKTSGIKNIEIIEYVNNNEGLCKPYNKIIEQSKYDIIILCHDDLIFKDNSWGKKIIKHFNESDYGILGIAGTTKLADNGVWWNDRELMLGNVKHQHNGKTFESRFCYSNDYKILECVAVDGLFIALHKNRIKTNFDERFKGFHFYDIPFCVLNHGLNVKIGVIFDVKVTHKSIGMTNESWEANRQLFVNLYTNYNDELKLLPREIKGKLNFDDSLIKLKKEPKIGIIIPTKGKLNLLFQCIDSIIEKSSYENYIIYIADTGSTDIEKNEIRLKYSNNDKIRLIEYDYYNFSEINNDVVVNHLDNDIELILFCNNDIKLINDAISRMVKTYNSNNKVGTIGCRLHFEDGKIQHAGINSILDNNGNFHVSHHGLKSWYNYYNGVKENKFGSTAALLLINKGLFLRMNGFVKTIECFEDVILNFSVFLAGYKNFFVGDAVCYHYESQTRNDDKDKISKLQHDYHHVLKPFLEKNKEKLYK